MKNLLRVSVLVLGLFLLNSNVNAQDAKSESIDRAKIKYRMALQFNDYAQAKSAIYDLMVLEPTNHSYLDSLAFMYFEFRQYASAALTSKEALKYNSQNQVLLQVAAQSFDQLGAIDQSLKMYQRLYNLSDDAFVLFEIANQQYELKNYDEAMINTELLLGKSVVNNNMVVVKNAENKEIQVPFKAVVYNLQGLIARAQGNEESAKKYFNSALELAPDYALVKENLNTSK
ncbi:hypothetical protein GCM10027429_18700 [Marivirga atlantica]|jgi:tetratricopeptide (TPR) repeat protein|uniref:Tetratricopeptide repeat protein n=1 Tax=Marivirga atlantica TaxID=1548457 RepID=A0A937A832_9BACT|nr:tetratricopeptide repeat protein [Marivirga atlantica]MBL0765487.1 tetratricopeptide repeat protein [Marivirga atlantica]